MMITFIGKKRKWTKKCTDKQYLADFLYTVQLVIPDACTNFKILSQVAPVRYLTKISLFITLE